MSVESTDAATASRGAVRVPLSVLDLVPIAEGSTAAEALRNSIDLAQRAEAFGYQRYWLAEHHLNPGVAGSAPHTLLGIIAGATERIRVGTAATILGNYEPLQVAESFGTVASLWPDRVDLGLGRSGFPPPAAAGAAASPSAKSAPEPVAAASEALPNRVVDGLVVPPVRPFHVDRARFALQGRLLGREPGDAARFSDTVDDLLAFFAGSFEGDGIRVTVQPAEVSGVQVWIHGSTAGESARIAGRLGLRYGANYHVAPSGVIESLAEYRAHFRPSAELDRPHTIVSVDVVVAETDDEARRIAAGYAEWVLSIREGQGAVPYPRPENAVPDSGLGSIELAAVQDRLDTRFIGSPETVVGLLETLQRVTGADELLVTTITHDHERRVASYRLLADAWSRADAADPVDAADPADVVDDATEQAALTSA